MNADPELESSPLCGALSSGGHSLDVQIYRFRGDKLWLLNIEDENGNSTVWDDRFASDQ
jgi:hypothetical protein